MNIFWFLTSVFFFRNLLFYLNPLSANPTKWSKTLKQFVGNFPTICFSVFDHFVGLALKGLKSIHSVLEIKESLNCVESNYETKYKTKYEYRITSSILLKLFWQTEIWLVLGTTLILFYCLLIERKNCETCKKSFFKN